MSRRISKKTLIILAILATPLALLFALLPRLIPADRLRDLASERIAEATGGEVHLGEASVRVFPRLIVSVADGSIAGSGTDLADATQAPNNLQSYRVALRRLEIDVALGPLLRKRIEAGKIRLVEPDVELITITAPTAEVERSAPGAGADNGDSAAAAATESSGGLAWPLAIAGVEVRDGRLTWAEAQSARRVEISGWQQQITGADLSVLIERLQRFTAPQEMSSPVADAAAPAVSLALSARVDRLVISGFSAREIPPLAEISLEGEIELPAAADRLLVSVAPLRWGAFEATADVEIPAARRGDQPIRWSAAIPPTDLAALLRTLLPLVPAPADPAAAAWLADGPVTAGSLTVDASGLLPSDTEGEPTEASLTGLAVNARVADCTLQLPVAGRTVAITGDAEVQDGRLAAAHWQLTQADAGLRAVLEVDPAGAATGGKEVRANVTGELDLAATLVLAAEVLNRLGRTAQADSLPPLTGHVTWQGHLVADSLAALTDTTAWNRLRSGGGPLRLALTGRGRDVGFSSGVPGAPWIFPAADFSLQQSALRLSATGLDHATAAGELRLSGALSAEPGLPELELKLLLERLDLDQLTVLLRAERQTAQASASHSYQWAAALVPAAQAAPSSSGSRPPGEMIPPDLQLAFTAEIDRLILQQALYTDASAGGTLRQRVLEIPEISMRRAGGTITGQAKIDYAADAQGLLNFAVKAHEVPTQDLLAPYAAGLAPFWEGTLSGQCSGDCRLGDRNAILSSLSVAGLLSGTAGIYHAQDLLSSIAPYLGDRQDLMDIRYREIGKTFKVEQGRLIIDSLRVDGLDTDWLGSGWVSFAGQMDLDLNVKLPAGFTPNLGALSLLADGLRDQDGRIALDLKLTGRSAAPKVTVDLEPVKAAGQDALKDKVQQGLGGLLDKLKGK